MFLIRQFPCTENFPRAFKGPDFKYRAPLKTLGPSQQHRIEAVDGGTQLGPHYAERR